VAALHAFSTNDIGICTETLVVVHDAVPARPVEPVRDRVKIAAAGGIPPLIARLSSQSTGTQERALNALGNLSLNVKNRGTIAAVAVFDLCHKYILYLFVFVFVFVFVFICHAATARADRLAVGPRT
jgi:hypothetical protein